MVSLITYGASGTDGELEFARIKTVARTKPATAIMRTLRRPELAEAESWLANGSPSKRLRSKEVKSDAVLEASGFAACSPDSGIELEGKLVEDGDQDVRGEEFAQEQFAGEDERDVLSQGEADGIKVSQCVTDSRRQAY